VLFVTKDLRVGFVSSIDLLTFKKDSKILLEWIIFSLASTTAIALGK
jgi:hypothetical protein